MVKVLFLMIATVLLAVSPTLARTPLEGGANPPDIRFLECDNHYWIHRGTSDALYYGGGGSLNSAHADRFQGRETPGFPRLSPFFRGKTPIVTEWTEERKVREFPLEDARKP